MKAVRNKQIVVGANFAGFPLKEAVKGHLRERGWTVTGLTPDISSVPVYHRIGFALGAKIAEDEFERALTLCGAGMGIHITASKVPHIHAAVCETVPSAKRVTAANSTSLLTMDALYVAERMAMTMVDAFLESELDTGYGSQEGFYEYHRIGYDECESFDYAAYKANGFEVVNPQKTLLTPEPEGLTH